MPDPELSRLERQLGRLLRVGVAVSAAALAMGLVCSLGGLDGGDRIMRGGLVLLMAIPVTRIMASFVDAVRRGDRLLSWATAFVLVVMALTVVYSWRLKR
ncbi:MAG TPA: DUF1634 domain-containing protein [Vicinamibacterales bacterium]